MFDCFQWACSIAAALPTRWGGEWDWIIVAVIGSLIEVLE
jgi:hypothetical protein